MKRIIFFLFLLASAGCYYTEPGGIGEAEPGQPRSGRHNSRYCAPNTGYASLPDGLTCRIAVLETRIAELVEMLRAHPLAGNVNLGDINSKIADLKSRNETLMKDLAELQARYRSARNDLEAMQDFLSRHGFNESPPVQKDIPNIPEIRGAVVGVSSKLNLLVINVGEDEGVKLGYEFTIFRDNKYIGKMVVEHVYQKQSAGRLFLDKMAGKPQPGDGVMTGLW